MPSFPVCAASVHAAGRKASPDAGNARFSLREGMFSSARSSSRRLTAFVRCVREDGADALASYLAANEAQGLLYHRDTVHFTGDYDISEDEAEILRLLREGSKP